MNLSPSKLNKFLLFQLPSAWLCGVRVKEINFNICEVGLKHSWINQNPFNSIYFAVQAMAAELSTGALVMGHIRKSNLKMSMLVVQNKSSFSKKATGKIRFVCKEGDKVREAIETEISSGEGRTFWLTSTGYDEDGNEVSAFEFQWSIKLKN